jgi:hypothetical protein
MTGQDNFRYEPPPPGVKGTLPPEVTRRMQELMEAGDRDTLAGTFLLAVAKLTAGEAALMRAAPAAAAAWRRRKVHKHRARPVCAGDPGVSKIKSGDLEIRG